MPTTTLGWGVSYTVKLEPQLFHQGFFFLLVLKQTKKFKNKKSEKGFYSKGQNSNNFLSTAGWEGGSGRGKTQVTG